MDRDTGRILCVHVTPHGRCHDRALLRRSRVRLKTRTRALVNAGFQGFQTEHSKTALPIKKNKRNPLTKQQKEHNRTLASQRVPVEHSIGFLKRFRILAERSRNRRRRFGLRINLSAAILNLEMAE